MFALHPLQVETVAWASELKGVLCYFFVFAALWLYVRWVERPRAWMYGLSFVAFVAALLSKPAAVTLPLLAWLLDYYLRRDVKAATRSLGWWLLPSIFLVWKTHNVQPVEAEILPFQQRIFLPGNALFWYAKKVFLSPFKLASDYGLTPQRLLASGFWFYAVGLMAPASLVVLWLQRKKYPLLFFAAAFASIAIVTGFGFSVVSL